MFYNTTLEFYNAYLASVEKAMKAKILLGSDYRAEISAFSWNFAWVTRPRMCLQRFLTATLTIWFVLLPVTFLTFLIAVENSFAELQLRHLFKVPVFEWQKAHSGSLRGGAHWGGLITSADHSEKLSSRRASSECLDGFEEGNGIGTKPFFGPSPTENVPHQKNSWTFLSK